MGGKIAPDELLLVQETYPERIDAAVDYAKVARRDVPMASGLLGLLHFILAHHKPRKSAEFLQVLIDGVCGEKGHPARVLRERFIKDKLQDRQLPPDAMWWAAIRCWNHYDKGANMRAVLIKRNPQGEWAKQTIRGLKK